MKTVFCFDPFNLYQRKIITNPNIALVGEVGSGKSSLLKTFALRSIAMGRKVYVPGDVKGEWSVVTRAVGGAVVSLGTGNVLNPLDSGRKPADVETEDDWVQIVQNKRLALLEALSETLLGRRLAALEHTALRAALGVVLDKQDCPIIEDVARELLVPSGVLPVGVKDHEYLADMGEQVGHTLMRLTEGTLGGMFNGQSTVRFDTALPMISIDLSHFGDTDKALPLILTCASAWMESALRDGGDGKRVIIYDEAHRIMKDEGLVARMRDEFKLSRAWGIANVLVLHRFSDLDAVGESDSQVRNTVEGLLNETSIHVVYRQGKTDLDSVEKMIKLSGVSRQIIPALATGFGLWSVAGRMFVVRHLLSGFEQKIIDTDAAMID